MGQYLRRPEKSPFEQEFAREILQAERQRVTILAIILTVALINSAVLFLFLKNEFYQIYHDVQMFYLVSLAQLGLIGYELIARTALGRFIALHREPPRIARYINALLETSFPSFMLLILVRYQAPADALQSNVILFYTLFIILSTLRLQFSLSVWTGLIASAEYIGIWLWYSTGHPGLLAPGFLVVIVQRGVIFLMLGIVAGLVSMQIRERVTRALRSVNEKNDVINVFGQHVSPMVVEKLLNQKAGDVSEMRFVCMMFLDIRNFTTFSEQSNPTMVIDYLNTLFASMINTINRHHGIINKFLGDGFMAVFGAPLSQGHDCQNAVAAAQEILSDVDRLIEAGKIPPTKIGIGLHAGEAITGTVGSSSRKEYTVIGDVVNVAARIEQLNKQFDSQLLISDTVWNAIGDTRPKAEPLQPLNIRGRIGSVQIWKLV